jgi:hypothetical protein
MIPMFRRHHFSFLHCLAAAALWALSALPAVCSTHYHGTKDQNPFLLIKKPAAGSVEINRSVHISIDADYDAKLPSLRVTLNGNDISKKVWLDQCDLHTCKLTGEVYDTDGLKDGPNRLSASIEGRTKGRVDVAKSDFRYHAPDKRASKGLGATQGTIEYYTPASVGLTTIPNGGGAGKAWVTITTGQVANVSDPVGSFPLLPNPVVPSQPYAPVIPYPDLTLSLPSGCSGTYQAVVLKRNEPTIMEAAACGNTEPAVEASLNTILQQNYNHSLGSSDLIIFGTQPGTYADPTLNTSDIGGTDYSKIPSASPVFPLYYIIAGVKGDTAGTAREASLALQTTQQPYTYFPTLGGTLTADNNGNYNLTSTGEKDFTIISSATNASMTFQFGAQWLGNFGTQTYTPPASAANEFWLIIFDRMAMQPIPVNAFKGATTSVDCGYTNTSAQCGMLFDVHADGGAALASVLNSVTSRDLIVLTTVGCPFDSASQASSALGDALQNIGGMRYTLDYLVSSNSPQTCNYSLVSVNDGNHETYNSNAAISSNIFSAQGQLGGIHGYLAPDHTGLYDVAGKDQMTMQSNVLSPVTNYTMEHIASQNRQDWQFTDTPGHLASYHDISYQLLNSLGETGASLYDIRSLYTQGNTGLALKVAGLAAAAEALSTSGKPSSWDTQAEDFGAVAHQISIELTQLNNALLYLTGGNGAGGVRGELNGSSASIFSEVSTIASDVSTDWSVSEKSMVNANPANWLNLGSGIVGLVGPILGAAGGPEISIFMGVMSSALRTGAAAHTIAGSTAIPSPETKYVSTLQELASDATTYNTYLLAQYDGAIDNTLSDYWKFYQVGVLASDTSSGWNLGDFVQGDAIAAAFQSSEQVSLWNDILPQLYGARTATSQASSNPATFGSYVQAGGGTLACVSAYPSVPATSMTANNSIGNNKLWDVYILAENQKPPSGQHNDTPVSGALTKFLTTNQTSSTSGGSQAGLNIPPMMLINNGPWTYSPIKIFNNSPNALCNPQTAPPIIP